MQMQHVFMDQVQGFSSQIQQTVHLVEISSTQQK